MENPIEDLMTLCNDGELLAGLLIRFRERVKRGMKFGDTLMHLERADNALAARMNLVADVMEVIVDREAKSS